MTLVKIEEARDNGPCNKTDVFMFLWLTTNLDATVLDQLHIPDTLQEVAPYRVNCSSQV